MGCGCSKKSSGCGSSSSSCGCSSCQSSSSCNSLCYSSCCDKFCANIEIRNSWNVPACDDTAQLYVPGLKTALIGSYISNPTYGYFKIVAVSGSGNKITVQNECLYGNAAPGTVVTAGTKFNFGPPPPLTTWADWAVTITPDTGLTVANPNIIKARYYVQATTCFWNFTAGFELVGTTANSVSINAPVTPLDDKCGVGAASLTNGDGSAMQRPFWEIRSGGILFAGSAAWVDGVDAGIRAQGFYEIDN